MHSKCTFLMVLSTIDLMTKKRAKFFNIPVGSNEKVDWYLQENLTTEKKSGKEDYALEIIIK